MAYDTQQIIDMVDEIVWIEKTFEKKGEKMWHRIADFFNVEYHKKYGEGTRFDLDYGKLLIIALCIYIAIKV